MLRNKVLPSLALFAILAFSSLSQARTFKNAYISFEMPDTWNCKLEQTEWVCRSEDNQESKEAVIILTAKEKGPTDSVAQYESHMNSSITTTTKTGQTLTSRVIYKAQTNRYNDQPWIDSLHQDSEVKHYYTRYLASIKDQIAILVTFSAHNKYYSKYSVHFANTVKSLRVIASKDLLSRPELGPLGRSGEVLGHTIGSAMPPDIIGDEDGVTTNKTGGLKSKSMLILGILILAILGYVGYRFYSKRK